MNMMSMPEDNLYQELLSDYMAEPEDNGFSAAVLGGLEARDKRELRFRRRVLLAAFFAGGLIAGLQLKKFAALMTSVTVPSVDLPGLSSIIPDTATPSLAIIGGVAVAIVALLMMERDGSAV